MLLKTVLSDLLDESPPNQTVTAGQANLLRAVVTAVADGNIDLLERVSLVINAITAKGEENDANSA